MPSSGLGSCHPRQNVGREQPQARITVSIRMAELQEQSQSSHQEMLCAAILGIRDVGVEGGIPEFSPAGAIPPIRCLLNDMG